jgi:hypothetical protein
MVIGDNLKSLKKKIEEDTNNWKYPHVFVDGKN